MPTYQYKREDGSIFEIVQKISADALNTCPETGQKVKRVITGGGGVVYKGTGWYVTDYKNKSNGASEGQKESGHNAAEVNSPSSSNGNGGGSAGNGKKKSASGEAPS